MALDRMSVPEFGKHPVSVSCSECHASVANGFARCHLCGVIRPELRPHVALIRDDVGQCVLTGSETDVFLPKRRSDLGTLSLRYDRRWLVREPLRVHGRL